VFKTAAATFDASNTWDFSTSSTFWEVPYVQVVQLSFSNLKDALHVQCKFDTRSTLVTSKRVGGWGLLLFTAYMLEVVQSQGVGGNLAGISDNGSCLTMGRKE